MAPIVSCWKVGAKILVSAEDYFSDYEEIITSLSDLEARQQQIVALGQQSGLEFYWRGQADASWGIHSSLHRSMARGKLVENVLEKDIVEVEEELIAEAREWIRPSVGARLTTVDLFARLQHHGIPTRLLDFTSDPLIAVFFACSSHSKADGRLFVAAAREKPSGDFLDSFGVPWKRGSETKPTDWGKSLFAFDDHEDFLRISRQSGVFLGGGTPSTQPHRRLKSSGVSLTAKDVRRSMSLPIALHSWSQSEAALSRANVRGRAPAVASALTIRIPARAKASLLAALYKQEYRFAKLFPDAQGLSDHGPVTQHLV